MRFLKALIVAAISGGAAFIGILRMLQSFDHMARVERFEEYVTEEAKSWWPA